MKNFLILFSIFVFAFLVRFYNFENRITFASEQARSLVVSAQYLKEKPSLLGQEYFRVDSKGHKLFTSAVFNYSLVPFLLLAKYNPLIITVYFTLLNIFTGFVTYVLTKKMFNKTVATISLILFLFNAYMIYHSEFIWVLNYMPLIGMLIFYLLWKVYKRKEDLKDLFLLGVLSGIGFGLEYLFALAILIEIFFLVKYLKPTVQKYLIFLLGLGLGDITQIVFDLRHDFYHFRTLLQFAQDTFNGVSGAGFIYYHFLHFWPVVLVIVSFVVYRISKKSKLLASILVILYLIFNLSSNLINFSKPVGMVEGLKYNDIENSASIIASDVKTNDFNVVTLYDFDTRGYVLRYFLSYIHNLKPMGEIEYPQTNNVYALSKINYDFEQNNPWELNVLKPYNVERLGEVGEGFAVYKLSRIVK